MMPVQARAVYIKKEAHEDPRSMARVRRMLPFVKCATPPRVIDDAAWHQLVIDEKLNELSRHGRRGAQIEPVVIFNQFLYHHDAAERARREKLYPELFRSPSLRYAGYDGWYWRRSGDEEDRRSTGLVCQPAYAIHSFWGCHFRCAYCNIGHVANICVNLEDWIEHLRERLVNPAKSPRQRLFQWDNGTDVVCWEPEYGGTKLLVELFAGLSDKYLELYVGKSDQVDFMLDFDHRGHTVCCWSLGPETQCRLAEPRSAGMEARIASARKCHEAGYPIRIRFSPLVPVRGWEQEVRHMVRRLFEQTRSELLTMEPLRFCTRDQLLNDFEPGLIDPEFIRAMERIPPDAEDWEKSQFPDDMRIRMYRVVLDEVAKVAPRVPVALCREKRRVWSALAADFARMGQSPDDYVCNCGPTSAGDDPRLVAAVAGC